MELDFVLNLVLIMLVNFFKWINCLFKVKFLISWWMLFFVLFLGLMLVIVFFIIFISWGMECWVWGESC